MVKYCLEEYVFNGFNASSKAREDVSKILLDYGYQSIGTNDKRKINSELRKIILTLKIYLKIFVSIKKEDILFLQTSLPVLNGILKIKRIKKFKVIYLIHDFFPLKYDDYELHKKEIETGVKYLNLCDFVICHNKRMKERLIRFGCQTKLIELCIFDYLLPPNEDIKERAAFPVVVYAGNLAKSDFLFNLDNRKLDGVVFNIYGLPNLKFKTLNYCGSFDADILPFILKGNYGLVWENGYNIKEENNYTRFNNPHKASLYIAAELPLIVWTKSAIADFVTENDIGITIESLDELEYKMHSITDKQYENMVKSCKRIRSKLIHGDYLNRVLNEIDEYLK